MDRTEYLRSKTADQLYNISMHPYTPATCGTISQWIKEIMELAGIDVSVYTTHSTRKAATSQAAEASVPIGVTLRAAGWTNSQTFAQYYRLLVADHSSFASAVLRPHTLNSHVNNNKARYLLSAFELEFLPWPFCVHKLQ